MQEFHGFQDLPPHSPDIIQLEGLVLTRTAVLPQILELRPGSVEDISEGAFLVCLIVSGISL